MQYTTVAIILLMLFLCIFELCFILTAAILDIRELIVDKVTKIIIKAIVWLSIVALILV